MNPDISIFMAGARPKWWERMYDSLKGNRCSYEIIAVGPNKPVHKLPDNFKYFQSSVKPCQAYAAASYYATGELIGWGCDDAEYFDDSLDIICEAYVKHGPKTIFAQRTIENRKDVTEEHYFFRHCNDTPRMAPLAFLNRRWFWELGGYDRSFICGQAENLICMNAFADGGKIETVSESIVCINHEQVHGGIWNKLNYRLGKRSFRKGYFSDRRYLEENYVVEGYGTYDEKTLKHGTISDKRLLSHHPYDYKNILTVAQGEQGNWS